MLVLTLASLLDRVCAHVRCALLLQRSACEGQSALTRRVVPTRRHANAWRWQSRLRPRGIACACTFVARCCFSGAPSKDRQQR